MIITVASHKGGVAKTTTAIHLAAYLQTLAPTLLLDADPTRNATGWCQRKDPREKAERAAIPFLVEPIEMAPKLARRFADGHMVIDTGQRPSSDDLQAAADGCDLLVVPAVPSALDTDSLGQTLRALRYLHASNYRVLLTCVAADAGRQVAELRELLADFHAPVFETLIPRLKAFQKAAGMGEIVRDTNDPQAARAWAAYVAVGKELLA